MHAFVTGASAGIGAAMAKAFAVAGYDVSLVARREDKLNEVADAIGTKVKTLVLPADLSQPDAAPGLITQAQEALGPVDVLINNAGIMLVGETAALTAAELERLIAVNIRSPHQLTLRVLPDMIRRGSGHIVNIASIAAFNAAPFANFYSGSKADLAQFSECLHDELRSKGIHVLTVYPGPVHTDMGHGALSSYTTDPSKGMLPWGNSETLAARILSAMRCRCRRIVYPRPYYLGKWFPGLARWLTNLFPIEAQRRFEP